MDYEHFKIKVYDNWELFLHTNQYPYLGRCYAWAIRPDANKVTDMDKTETDELFNIIVPEWDRAVSELFDHDWPNVSYLGNTSPHLHWHLIPRYHTPRKFYDTDFIDPNPTGNYAPYPKKPLPEEVLMQIKRDIKSKI